MSQARAIANRIGVTRVADVTRLDRFGLPCWQAIRPFGRSLSVHQGKGRTHGEAQLGAILEAFEAHSGETFDAPVFSSSFRDLAAGSRPPTLADFVKDDSKPIPPDTVVDWVIGITTAGTEVAVPFACVSMDFTRILTTPFDRSSNGVAVGTTREEAVRTALLEMIERDAIVEWKQRSLVDRMADQIEPQTIDPPWFGYWLDRARECDAFLRCYRVESFTGIPIFACEIGDVGKSATPFRAIHGHAAHPDAEVALFRAVTEAMQGRSAYIAGSRDDLPPSDYSRDRNAVRVAFGLPLPPSMDGTDYQQCRNGPDRLVDMVAAIEQAGLGPVVIVDLGQAEGFHVVRVWACGLGARDRRRRRAA